MSDLPARAPTVTSETEPFWSATVDRRLRLPRCVDCDHVVWYPRDHCPVDGGAVDWVDVDPTGVIYSFSIARRGHGAWTGVAPYVVAYVELDAGPRIMTNIVGCEPDDVTIGQRVTAVFDPTGDHPDAPAIVRFRPL